jgi:hypothetical protein
MEKLNYINYIFIIKNQENILLKTVSISFRRTLLTIYFEALYKEIYIKTLRLLNQFINFFSKLLTRKLQIGQECRA